MSINAVSVLSPEAERTKESLETLGTNIAELVSLLYFVRLSAKRLKSGIEQGTITKDGVEGISEPDDGRIMALAKKFAEVGDICKLIFDDTLFTRTVTAFWQDAYLQHAGKPTASILKRMKAEGEELIEKMAKMMDADTAACNKAVNPLFDRNNANLEDEDFPWLWLPSEILPDIDQVAAAALNFRSDLDFVLDNITDIYKDGYLANAESKEDAAERFAIFRTD